MTRIRKAGDRTRDLAASRQVEGSVAAVLRASPLGFDLEDHAGAYEPKARNNRWIEKSPGNRLRTLRVL